jgi:6-phosphogluconolactonase
MQLHISKNLDELSATVAGWMINYINDVLQKQERFTIALSGGSTPEKLHKLLASEENKDKVDWGKMHIFWGDERFVPFDDERNNAKMAFNTLLNYVAIKKENIHVMQTENISPEESATAYEELLRQYFGSETSTHTFDLVLLGMGDDGHTLSLFPGKTEVIHEKEKWCTSLWLEEQNMYRITLTHPVVNKAACVAFLTNGSKKTKALNEVLKGEYNPNLYPSQIIKPEQGELHWFVDDAAAGIQ